jgi:signal transduction histidine kinase
MASIPQLAKILANETPEIINIINELIRQTSLSQYQAFILETSEGRRRLRIWCEKLIKSLEEGPRSFFKYQQNIGIKRAEQGFHIDGASQFYSAFLQAVWKVCRSERRLGNYKNKWVQKDSELEQLHQICLQGLTVFSNAYLQARENQIDERLLYLDNLHQYTHDIIGRQSLSEIASLLLMNASRLFKSQGCSLIISHENISEMFNHPAKKTPEVIATLLKSVLTTGCQVFLDKKMKRSVDIDGDPVKLQVCIPIHARTLRYGAFAMYSKGKGFRFTSKQLGILNQMLYITAVALENCLMIEEIELNRKELQALTGKMITLQEEERKRISTDIHDTIAQTLTGAGFQIQYCKGLIGKDQKEFHDILEGLLQTVDRAIDQSRELISNLRPGLIDTVGLVPALNQLFDQFTKETGIEIERHIPTEAIVAPETGICLYRVLQSALSNIYQHAGVNRATVKLTERENSVHLIIVDHGNGFDLARGWSSFKNPDKLGLLGMKERVETAGGTFRLRSALKKGCRIDVTIPISRKFTDEKN